MRRRLDDLLAASGQTWSDTALNEEINEAIYDIAGEVELEGSLWRLGARHSLTLTPGTSEYSLAGLTLPFVIDRKLIRTDVTPVAICRKIEFSDLEAFAGTSGVDADDGYYYAIGPGSGTTGPISLWFPVAPRRASTLVLHYMRTPTLLNHDTSDTDPNVATQPDIPVMLHRLIALKAAMNLLGPDQDGGGAYQALAAEYADVQRRGTRLLRRRYESRFVEDVMGD